MDTSAIRMTESLLRLQRRMLVATAPPQQRNLWALAELGRLTGALAVAECVGISAGRHRVASHACNHQVVLQQLCARTTVTLLGAGSLDDLLGAISGTLGNSRQASRGVAADLLQAGVSMLVFSVARVEITKGILLAAFDPTHANDEHGRLAARLFRLAHSMIIAPVSYGDGEPRSEMTGRPAEVAQLLLKGHSEKEIAGILGISPGTVHTYVVMVYRYYRVHSRAELSYRILGSLARERNGSTADAAEVLHCGHVHLTDRVPLAHVLAASN